MIGNFHKVSSVKGIWFWVVRLGPVFLLHVILLFAILPYLFSNYVPTYFYSVGLFIDDYHLLANSLLQGYGYRFGPDLAETIMREPGYPLFLAGVFGVFGYGLKAALLGNILLSFGIVLMIVWMARAVSADPAVPFVASLLFLLHPGILITESRAGFEMFFIFLLMIFVLVLQKAMKTQRAIHFFVAGLVLGVVILTRGTTILFPGFLLLYIAVTSITWQELWRRIPKVCGLATAAALVMSPWVIRNYRLVHEFIPTTTNAGISAQKGQYICKNMSGEKSFWEVDRDAAAEGEKIASNLGYEFRRGYFQYFFKTRDELDFSRFVLRKTMDGYIQDPVLFVKCSGMNLFNFWFRGKRGQVTLLNMLLQIPFILVALAGAYLLWKRNQIKQVEVIILFILYLCAVHVPVLAQARYSVPLIPFLAILASIAIINFWRKRQQKADSIK